MDPLIEINNLKNIFHFNLIWSIPEFINNSWKITGTLIHNSNTIKKTCLNSKKNAAKRNVCIQLLEIYYQSIYFNLNENDKRLKSKNKSLSHIISESNSSIKTIPNKIKFYNKLIQSVASSPNYSQKFRENCFKMKDFLYLVALKYHIGDKFPEGEEQFLEFSGLLNQSLTMENFESKYVKFIVKNIAAFINGAVLNYFYGYQPSIHPAQIIFGIDSKSLIIHGVLLPDDPKQISPLDACKNLQNKLIFSIRSKIIDQIEFPLRWANRIIELLNLEVKLLSSDEPSKIHALIILELNLVKPGYYLQPTALKDPDEEENRYFIRTANAKTRPMNQYELNILFPNILNKVN